MTGKFRLIVADPPWNFRDRLRQTATKRGSRDVYTASIAQADLLLLPVRDLAADNAVLFMWSTSSHLREALAVMDAWGFTYKQLAVWGKVTASGRPHIGMGRMFRQSLEPALVGVRGSVAGALANRSQSNLFLCRRGEHSQKPDAPQDALELMFPSLSPRLELFARRCRPGWTCVGDAIDGRDIRNALSDMEKQQ